MFLVGRHTIQEYQEAYAISRERELVTPEIHKPNDFYGHAYQMKRFAGLPDSEPLKLAIEHAPFFFDKPLWAVDKKAPFAFLASFAEDRIAQIRQESNKIALPLGPLIHYAEDLLLPDAFYSEKKRLGRNLLVYPSHSTHHIQVTPDIELLKKAVESKRDQFDVIRFCVYWADLDSTWCQALEQAGYEIVCAGHIFDPEFNSRQKQLMQLSDLVASNSPATHFGYAIVLGRPVWYVPTNQQIAITSYAQSGTTDTIVEQTLRRFDWVVRNSVYLTDFSEQISDEEREVYSAVQGFSHLYRPDALKELLVMIEKLDQMGINRQKDPLAFLQEVLKHPGELTSSEADKLTEIIEMNLRAAQQLQNRLKQWGHPDTRVAIQKEEQTMTLVDILELLSEGKFQECLAACETLLKSGPNPEIEQCRRICLENLNPQAAPQTTLGSLSAMDNGFYGKVNLNPKTLANMAASDEIWSEILSFNSQLASDEYVSYLDKWYRECHSRFGRHWYYLDIVNVLYGASKAVKPKNYLEIGVRRGRSVCMVAKATPTVNIFAFDMWKANYAGMDNPGPDFVRSELSRMGHRGQVQFVNGNSHETLKRFFLDNPTLTFDMMTVDGDHSEVGAAQDLNDVIPHLSVGGILVFDDISHPSHPYLLNLWKKTIAAHPGLVSYEFTEMGYGVAFAIRMR